MSSFEVQQSVVDGATVIRVVGEIDLSTEVELRLVADGLTASGDGPVVMDYTAVAFIDSTGMATLMRLHKRLREQGRSLAIATGTSQVRRMFELTGLAQSLPTAETLPGALEVVGRAGSAQT